MEPIPPTPNAGVAFLLAQIEIIGQAVRGYNKRPLPATEDQVKGLVKLAERDRPLVVKVETEAVVAQLVGQVEELNKQLVATMGERSETFLGLARKLLDMVDNRMDCLKDELELGVKAVQVATVDMKAGAALIPSKITVDFKQGWRWVAGLVLGPVAFLLLGMGFAGQFSKVSKSDFEQLQKQQQQSQAAQQKAEAQEKLTNSAQQYFFAQIKKYKAKNPNTKDFPAYKGFLFQKGGFTR